MKYFKNGREISYQAARNAIYMGALYQGYDTEEALAIFARAHEPGENGEDAREMLWGYDDGIEMETNEC